MKNQNIALVTGASRGLGAAVALELAKRGTHVIALARTVGGLEELDDRIQAAGGQATLVPLDITDEAGMQRLCLSIHERWGHLDLLVHCAIYAAPLTPAGHVMEKDWDKLIGVNIRATQRLIALTEPLLKAATSGTAVFVHDNCAGKAYFAGYGASKAAQNALVQSWANESAKTGPKVVSFTPNPMPTATRARFHPGEDRARLNDPAVEAKRLLDVI